MLLYRVLPKVTLSASVRMGREKQGSCLKEGATRGCRDPSGRPVPSPVHRRLSLDPSLLRKRSEQMRNSSGPWLSCRERYQGQLPRPWRTVGAPDVSCCQKLHWGPYQQAAYTKGDPWVPTQCSVGLAGSGYTVSSFGVSGPAVASAGSWGMPVRARRL